MTRRTIHFGQSTATPNTDNADILIPFDGVIEHIAMNALCITNAAPSGTCTLRAWLLTGGNGPIGTSNPLQTNVLGIIQNSCNRPAGTEPNESNCVWRYYSSVNYPFRNGQGVRLQVSVSNYPTCVVEVTLYCLTK